MSVVICYPEIMRWWGMALVVLGACGDAAVEPVDITCEVDADCAEFENRYCGNGLCRQIPVARRSWRRGPRPFGPRNPAWIAIARNIPWTQPVL